MSDPRVRLVLNPHAGAGAAGRRLPEIVRAFQRRGISYEVARTSEPGDATRIARASFDDGVDVIAVAGGDGTLNEVVQAFLDDAGKPRSGPDLALIPAGTGGDFKRTVHLPAAIDDAVERLHAGSTEQLDLGILQLVGWHDEPVTKAFVNITSFGMGGVTDRLVNTTPKWMGGKTAFFVGAARAMVSYRNARVRVRVDGDLFHEGPVFNVAIANGRYFGGGMLVAPEADPSDGVLEVVAMGDLSKVEALRLSSRIYKGTHLGTPKVTTTRGTLIEAEAVDPALHVLLDMDGETPGRLPIRVNVAPKLLRFRT